MFSIPLEKNTAFYEYTTDLDGLSYIFKFKYNSRSKRFSLTVKDDSENDLLTDLVLVMGTNFVRFNQEGLFSGMLFLVNFRENNVECDIDNSSIDVELIYDEP